MLEYMMWYNNPDIKYFKKKAVVYSIMKVTSGIKRGTLLSTPEDLSIRPTTDKVKQAIFNMIQFMDVGTQALDLFSGSGSMGIEAISRYLIKCDFVDKDTKTTINNIKKCNFSDYADIYKEDFATFLKKTKKKYSLIFLDPPYHNDYITASLDFLLKNNLLEDNAVLIMESDSDEEYIVPENIEIIKEKSYGRIKIRIGVFNLL